MDNVVIGQYIPGNSIIHRMDPRVKIVLLVFMIAVVFLAPSLFYVAMTFVTIIALILFSRIPLRKVLKGLKALVFLLAFTVILQLGYSTSGKLLFSYKMHMTVYNIIILVGVLFFYMFTKRFTRHKFIYLLLLAAGVLYLQKEFTIGPEWFYYRLRVYDQGVNKACFVFLRVINIVLLSSLLTFTTNPNDLNNGIESVISPLKVIKVPVSEIAMMLSLVLRFVPTLLEETNKIMKAQASRGVDFKESSFNKKIRQIVSLLVPMFVISFKRAEELADAMESRGYVIGEPRTKIDVMKIRKLDIVAIGFVLILLGLMIWSKIVI